MTSPDIPTLSSFVRHGLRKAARHGALVGALLATAAGLPTSASALELPTPPGLPKPPRLPDLPRFGRIDIGRLPLPKLLHPEPVVALPQPGRAAPAPVYMRVPPGHARNWDRHCHRYGACARPVYFVQEQWYQDVYVPHRHGRPDDHDRRGHRGGHRRDH